MQSCIDNDAIVKIKEPEYYSVLEIFEPFLTNGLLSLPGDTRSSTLIKMLRDTIAPQCFTLSNVLPDSQMISSGNSVFIQGVECEFNHIPLHNDLLTSDLVTEPVAVGLRSFFSISGVHLQLGNYQAEGKIVTNALVVEIP